METKDFLKTSKSIIHDFVLEHLDKTDDEPTFHIYTVWVSKTLQNNKAMLSTTLSDGMYYEATYNGDKGEIYLDVYKKFQNISHKV